MTIHPTRRNVIHTLTAGAAALWTPGVFAEELTQTPRSTAGPFYPDKLPLDTDNDLLVINDATTPAIGQVTHLTGRVLTVKGSPIRNAIVEIWQVDGEGSYLHSRGANSRNDNKRDKHFQGFGRFLTDSKGQYYFRTIKPVTYPGRTPHIHVGVKLKGRDMFTTQCYIKGEPRNERDFLYNRIRDPKARQNVTLDFKPIKDSKAKELAAHFDIVLGFTPEG